MTNSHPVAKITSCSHKFNLNISEKYNVETMNTSDDIVADQKNAACNLGNNTEVVVILKQHLFS
jgi:hypothetical protein